LALWLLFIWLKMPEDSQASPASNEVERRPIPVRTAWWSQALATGAIKLGLKPNQVSVLSVCFAMAGSILFFLSRHAYPETRIVLFLCTAACIQMRLLCNMLDGLMAVEGALKSKLGVLFNEIPDRLSDTLFLVFAGYAAGCGELGVVLGWLAALLSVLTAYIRAFGGGQGLKQDFCGPMAKPHRMFVLTIGCLVAAAEPAFHWPPRAIATALFIIASGAFITCIRRTVRMAVELEKRES
jgi:phosphatidylglycerophosphate synthase